MKLGPKYHNSLRNRGSIKYRLQRILGYFVLTIIVSLFFDLIDREIRYPNLAFISMAYYGIILGIIQDIFSSSSMLKLPFWLRVFGKTILLILSFALLVVIIVAIFDPEDNDLLEEELPTIFFILWERGIVINLLLTAFLVILLSELFSILGRSFIWEFITGKYNKPRREARIFMFLDLADSTTITEEIGDEQYYEYINDCYFILTKSLRESRGDIVKYLGDEVILTWHDDSLKNRERAVKLYFQFQKDLSLEQEYFKEKYGHVPLFKAGIHHGLVVTAYVGHKKRQKDFSGDVMNTCARIQGQCSKLGYPLVVSQSLISGLNLSEYNSAVIQDVELKGKQNTLNLVGFESV